MNPLQSTRPTILAAPGLGKTEFAASFSNAGGLGIITALNYEIKSFKNELEKMYSLTDKPFGVNLTVVPKGVRFGDENITNETSLQIRSSEYINFPIGSREITADINISN